MFVVVWAVGGLGRPGLLLRKAAGCCSCFSLVWRGWGWLVAVCWCRRHACLLLLPACVWGVGAGGCPCLLCGGGMLSGFWGSAPWLPGLLFCCLFCGWWGVGVGGLVVNCIVDASILL